MSPDSMAVYPGRYPAVVKEYLADSRQARIAVDGLTDGAKVHLLADIEYPIGDRAQRTEIDIAEGDTVWIAFIGGDSRYPIITGYRHPDAGNEIGWRRMHHANIELSADGSLDLIITDGPSLKLNGSTVEVKGASKVVLNGETLGGCVGENSPCLFTGSNHIGASTTVKVG